MSIFLPKNLPAHSTPSPYADVKATEHWFLVLPMLQVLRVLLAVGTLPAPWTAAPRRITFNPASVAVGWHTVIPVVDDQPQAAAVTANLCHITHQCIVQ